MKDLLQLERGILAMDKSERGNYTERKVPILQPTRLAPRGYHAINHGVTESSVLFGKRTLAVDRAGSVSIGDNSMSDCVSFCASVDTCRDVIM